jgi:hypothetical protein
LSLKRESLIERRILEYLEANPGAHDTLRGISEWWLLKQQIAETTNEVARVVEKLVAKGELLARLGPDGQVHYRRKHAEKP